MTIKQKDSTGFIQAHPITVFLVDDDVDDREMFAEAVADLDIQVHLICAEDGLALFSKLMELNAVLPDLIFLDLNMPNMNGKECLDKIRKSEQFQHIPVVIYSTSSSVNDVEDTFSKGANLYVRKPFSYQELKTITKSVLTIDWSMHPPYGFRNDFLFTIKNA